jgi:hypothetical protein
MANPQVIVEFLAKTDQLKKGADDVDTVGGRVKGAAGKIGASVAAGFAVGAVVNFGKSAVSAAQESEVATDRLRQVFRSMGDETGEAAKAAEAYASELSKKTAIEDETILASQALLATFGKVSDETARQAGVFDRATAAAADLAAAGFGSMEGNAKQLGKALNDPVKGISALARSGVTFTAQEKERIKTLVESNKLTEAQAVILKAVETQVQGTAEATATESEKMQLAFGEAQESVGKGLLPVLEALTPVITILGRFVEKNTTLVLALAAAFIAASIALKIVTAAQLLFNFTLAATPFGLILLGVAATIAAAVLLARNWDSVSRTVGAAFDRIENAARAVFDWIKRNWPLLLGILTGPFGLAAVAIIKNWDKIEEGARALVAAIRGAFEGLLSYMGGIVDRVANVVGRIVNAIKAPINAVIGAWNQLEFRVPRIQLPSIRIAGRKIGGQGFGPFTFEFPDLPKLARGGIVTGPTVAMLGEAGPEAVIPLKGGTTGPIEVRVFIGDQELRGIVKTEVRTENTRTAQTLLAGAV